MLAIKGDTSVGRIVVNGSVKSVSGKMLDVSTGGAVTINGGVKSLQFRNISGSMVTVDAGPALSFVAATVLDSSVASASTLKSMKVMSWTDGGNSADRITAPAISSIRSAGAFSADVQVDSIGSVRIGGELSGDVRSTGNIKSVSAASVSSASIMAGVASGFSGLPDSSDDFTNTGASIKSFAITGNGAAGTFAASYLAAPLIRRASLGIIDTASGAGVFGIAAETVGSARLRFDGASRISYRNLSDPSQSVTEGNAVIRII